MIQEVIDICKNPEYAAYIGIALWLLVIWAIFHSLKAD